MYVTTEMSDKEAQADEVLALASIYESSMFSANENAGLYSGQFKVFPQLPQPFYVMKDLNDEEKSRHQVEHLPPITLHFELPSNYPSTSPPAFTLACKWLNRKQLSELCEKLDKICLENKGDVVLFQWFNFLNEESLSTLSIGGSLNLCEAVLKTKCKKQNSVEKIEDKKNKLTDEKNIFKINDQTAQCEDVEKPASTGCAERNISVSTLSHFKANPMKKENKRNKFFGRNANNKEQWKNQFYKTNRTSHSFSKRHWQKSRGGNPLSIERQRTRLEQEPSKSTGATNLDENCKYDERAVQETVSETELLTVILEYNKLRQQQVFDQSFFTCKICFEEKLGSQCKAFRPCNHVFCKGCLKSYFELQISSGSVNRLNCAEDKCNSQALPSMVKESVEQSPCLLKMSTNKKQMESRTILKEICYIQIRELVEPELYLKYDRLLLTTTLDTMSDIIYCPRRSCHCPVLVEPDSNMASCPSCFLVFCVYCNMTYHGVVPCKLRPDEQRKIVQDYINGDENGKKLLEQRYGRQQVQQLVDNVLSEKWIKVNSKPCPNCNAHIEKLDGCNKMTCWRCDTYFCWLCLARLTKGNPYLHYNDLKSSCNGKLFQGINENDDNDDDDDEDDDENWELGQFL